jgi:hypothetical protein
MNDWICTPKKTVCSRAFVITFTKEELKEYYQTIRNNPNISDKFKLKIANAILDDME